MPNTSIYEGSQKMGGEFRYSTKKDAEGNLQLNSVFEDWAVIKLKKALPTSVKAVPINPAQVPIDLVTKVSTIGYPNGLPQKASMNGRVIRSIADGALASGVDMFETDLDIFGGSSGGPVFAGSPPMIVGVVSGTATVDYEGVVKNGTTCITPNVVTQNTGPDYAGCSYVKGALSIVYPTDDTPPIPPDRSGVVNDNSNLLFYCEGKYMELEFTLILAQKVKDKVVIITGIDMNFNGVNTCNYCEWLSDCHECDYSIKENPTCGGNRYIGCLAHADKWSNLNDRIEYSIIYPGVPAAATLECILCRLNRYYHSVVIHYTVNGVLHKAHYDLFDNTSSIRKN